MSVLLLLLALAQEPDEIPIIPSRDFRSYQAIPVEVKVPPPFRFSLTYEAGTDAFVPRFRYGAPLTKITAPTRVFTSAIGGSRWRLDAQRSSATSGEPATRSFVEIRGAPVKFDIFWVGLGVRYEGSSHRYRLYEGLDADIVSVNQYRSLRGSLGLMIGKYNASSIEIMGFYGKFHTADQLGLVVGPDTVGSLLDTVLVDRTNYWGVGVNGTARFWGVALETSSLGYVTSKVTRAIPGPFVLLEGRLTYTSPWKLGLFASRAKVLGFPKAQPSSVQSFNNRWTAGVLVQLP